MPGPTSKPKPTAGLSVVLLATVAVIMIGVAESVDGLATVADTGTRVASAMIVLTALAVIVRAFSRRTTHDWPRRGMAGLVGLSSLLLVVLVVVTYRAHTASGRFENRAAELPLPTGYEVISADKVDAQHTSQPQHAVRAWQVPTGAGACADLERAFSAWAKGDVQTFNRGSSCVAVDAYTAEKAEASVSEDGSTVVLEMWLRGSSLIHF